MTEPFVYIIEKWQKAEPYRRLETVPTAFSDINYAVHQVEAVVLKQIKELEHAKVIDRTEALNSIREIPGSWIDITDQLVEDVDTGEYVEDPYVSQRTTQGLAYLHKQDSSPFVYIINRLPLLEENFSDVIRQ